MKRNDLAQLSDAALRQELMKLVEESAGQTLIDVVTAPDYRHRARRMRALAKEFRSRAKFLRQGNRSAPSSRNGNDREEDRL